MQILENANWAPTHKRTEPWRFSVFSGNGLQKLADFQAGLYEQVAKKRGDYNEIVHGKMGKNPLKCSHVISIGMARNELVPEVEEIASVAAAVQNMKLTAHANGVGCYWGSGGITYMEEAKEFFNLGTADKLLGFLYMGLPESSQNQGNRTPIEDKTTWYD